MDTSNSSVASFETETAAVILPRMEPGNLALCQTTRSIESTECLGWHIGDKVDDVMKPLSEITDGEGNVLNWRFEDGFLRAVGSDGHATDRCLGPAAGVTTLNGNTSEPYELVVQDCPDRGVHNGENIFEHGAVIKTPKTSPTETTPEEVARHMKFLVVGDGRVQSLARVSGSKTPGKDIINDKPFCLTAMKWDGDEHTKAYLIPCREFGIESEDVDTTSDNLEERVRLQQQLFDIDNRSSYDSFLFELHSEDQRYLQLAYQIGYNGNSAANREAKNYDRFDSFLIRVMSGGDSSPDQDPNFVFERTVSPGPDSNSGIVVYPFSNFGTAGRMEAHLLGTSRNGLETSWLASTSFVVSDSDVKPLTNSVTWALVTFSAFMAFYVIVVKANRIFCNDKRKKKRESELTAATANMIANGYPVFVGANDDTNIRLPSVMHLIEAIDVDLPHRISEEDEFDMDSDESDEDDNRDDDITEPETVTSVGSNDLYTNDIETAQQPHREERS